MSGRIVGMPSGAVLLHIEVLVVVVIAYVVLTALGHDGNPLLWWVGGQSSGGVIQAATIGGK
jgi:hypothetical protein